MAFYHPLIVAWVTLAERPGGWGKWWIDVESYWLEKNARLYSEKVRAADFPKSFGLVGWERVTGTGSCWSKGDLDHFFRLFWCLIVDRLPPLHESHFKRKQSKKDLSRFCMVVRVVLYLKALGKTSSHSHAFCIMSLFGAVHIIGTISNIKKLCGKRVCLDGLFVFFRIYLSQFYSQFCLSKPHPPWMWWVRNTKRKEI